MQILWFFWVSSKWEGSLVWLEHPADNRAVDSSNLSLPTRFLKKKAWLGQMAEKTATWLFFTQKNCRKKVKYKKPPITMKNSEQIRSTLAIE